MQSRRGFLKLTAAGMAAGPMIWLNRAHGANAASNRITIGCIGMGRMGLGDMKSILSLSDVRVVAVCDVDRNRREHAKQVVDQKYQNSDCRKYGDFREVIARQDIDAVTICTPNHWHALPAIYAARAGKDIFLQKPLTYTIEEGRVLADTVKRYGRVMQVGSQQRSDGRFRFACELVQNGRIGKLQKIEVGCGYDPTSKNVRPEPVPPQLDYDMWLGPAPIATYCEKRVHPKKGYGRPGWLRCSDYTVGMMIDWGSHHMDIAHWGMACYDSGPLTIDGWADYPQDGVWDVHRKWNVHYTYAGGIDVFFGDNTRYKQGVKFIGSDGWVYVRRGHIDAHPKSLLREKIGPNEIHLYPSGSHKRNWINCIRTRQETAAPVENGHRSNSACLLGEISSRLGRKLKWDPVNEHIENDKTANALLRARMRAPWRL